MANGLSFFRSSPNYIKIFQSSFRKEVSLRTYQIARFHMEVNSCRAYKKNPLIVEVTFDFPD